MKLFTNWTNEDFTHTWNNEPKTFKANSFVELEDELMEHFAYHLAVRELNKMKMPTDSPELQEFINKCNGIEKEATNDIIKEEVKVEEELTGVPESPKELEIKEVKKPVEKKTTERKTAEKIANF